MFRCEICARGPAQNITVFRVNPKGEKGIFRCSQHLQSPPEKELRDITDLIEKARPQKRGSGVT